MDLERLAIRLRPRSGWEAVDLGFVLARAWWRPVYLSWLAVAAPIGVLLVLLLGVLGLVAFWWLLPLFGVLPLHVLSRAAFGDSPSVRETLRAAPDLMRRALPELGPRRLMPSRTATLPVHMLERLSGAHRRQRVAVLLRGGGESASWASFLFVLIEIALLLAAVALVAYLVPGWIGFDKELFLERFVEGAHPGFVYSLAMLGLLATMLAIEPLNVAVGFAVYLSQRTSLEGWDLEIAFRRIAARIRALRAAAVWLIAVTAVVVGGSTVPAVQAQETTRAAGDGFAVEAPRDPREVADEVLERPELRQEEEVDAWRLRDFDDRSIETERTVDFEPGAVLSAMAQILEILLWVILVAALATIALWATGRLSFSSRTSRDDDEAPERLFGLDLRPETLPDDVAASAEALWAEGRHADALSLLYRAALAHLVDEGATLRESFTEDDCRAAAREVLDGRKVEIFDRLTAAWQSVAYAHRLPPDEVARALWSDWRTVFDAPRVVEEAA